MINSDVANVTFIFLYHSFYTYGLSIGFLNKAELLREGMIFLVHLFARAILLMKKLKIQDNNQVFNF